MSLVSLVTDRLKRDLDRPASEPGPPNDVRRVPDDDLERPRDELRSQQVGGEPCVAIKEREPAQCRSQLRAPGVGHLFCRTDSLCEDQSRSEALTASAGISDTATRLFR